MSRKQTMKYLLNSMPMGKLWGFVYQAIQFLKTDFEVYSFVSKQNLRVQDSEIDWTNPAI